MVRIRRSAPRASPVDLRHLWLRIRDHRPLRGSRVATGAGPAHAPSPDNQDRGDHARAGSCRGRHHLTEFCARTARAGAIVARMIDRRYLLLGAGALLTASPIVAQAAGMSRVTAYAFSFKGLDGNDILLSSYAGHPILVVNTASLCGYTPQYAGLQELWTRYRYRDRGLIVLGVPSNDFGGQEPGGKAEIAKTAQGDYHITFPLSEKVAVKGQDAHPFY